MWVCTDYITIVNGLQSVYKLSAFENESLKNKIINLFSGIQVGV